MESYATPLQGNETVRVRLLKYAGMEHRALKGCPLRYLLT
jgi:hypothetical protein